MRAKELRDWLDEVIERDGDGDVEVIIEVRAMQVTVRKGSDLARFPVVDKEFIDLVSRKG